MARPALALGGIALIGVGVAMGLGWWWPTTAQADGEVRDRITNVRIDNGSGRVTIRAGDVQSVAVHQSFDYNWSKPSDGYRVEGDQLVLGSCGWNCSVDYEVVVPRGISVAGKNDSGGITVGGLTSADVATDSGSIEIRDVAGTVKAHADSGDVDLSGIGQDVTAKADSGTIRGDRLRGKVDADTDSGDIALSLEVAQDVHAQADSGHIELNVPNDRYRVQGSSDSGDRDISVATDPAAPHLLELSTDSGGVTVKTR